MKFETHVAKFDDHEVFSSVVPKLPTVRLFLDNKYALGISLHKWNISEGTQKGNYIAIYKICDFESSWESIDLTNVYEFLQTQTDSIRSFDIITLEDASFTNEAVYVFKFSVNIWRRVMLTGKKVKKWTYTDEKPSKEDASQIQRLLQA